MNGVLIVDKPAGWTSHDVVGRARRILREKSVGHLGTLDPLATGVLPLVTGSLTRLAQFYVGAEKRYEGVIRFGFATNTYDADGEIIGEVTAANFGLADLREVAKHFVGVISQVPPPFSAKKINGVPAYKLARKQQDVELKAVEVEVKEFEIAELDGDRARFSAHVASGTYMRSIAHDLGQRLGCGAHLESLRRTAVAEFDLSHAHTMEQLEERAGKSGSSSDSPAESPYDQLFIHPRQLLPQLPCVTADEAAVRLIRNGRAVNLLDLSRARQVKVFAGQRELLCIATRVAGTLFHPKIVFPGMGLK